jgi:D-alanyl-lipoteichoic acid acyltransferase DltB (MBOAT superfamily)
VYFNSLHFIAFLIVVLAMTWPLRRAVPARNGLLLVASYYFYGCWDWRFLSLIVISTLVDYLVGLAFDIKRVDPEVRPVRTRRHKLLLLASLATNLGLLGFFKYFGFFVDSAQNLLAALGLNIGVTTLHIILPVGISFYTFQTLSYTIDLYRGKITTERNLLNFALFVAFFPQLVAGPIERASRLLPQIRNATRFSWGNFQTGFYLIGWGLFKKVVIADNIGKVADMVFASPNPTGVEVIMGVYSFAVQVYCDFSGYSDIARGVARCLGFELMLNFNLPYFATNPSDLWRRWHISLSTWLRDYLYISLGGSRRGTARTYFSLMATMALGGLWHGAAWTFVTWGIYHGALLCLHRAAEPLLERFTTFRRQWAVTGWFWIRVFFMFQLWCVGLLLFRAESMQQVGEMTRIVMTDWRIDNSALGWYEVQIFFACSVLFFSTQLLQWLTQDLKIVLRFPVLIRALVYAAGMLAFIWFGEYGGEAFIYFQF